MNYSIKFIFKKEANRIFNVFTNLFDIRIAFFSSSGKELSVGKNKPICSFCSLLRERLDLEIKCLDLDRKKRLEAAQQKKLIVYQCHGGMPEAIRPIYIEDELIGFVMIGQFRTSGKPMNKLP